MSATCERGFSIRTLTKTSQQYLLGGSLLAALMVIDMNGPLIRPSDLGTYIQTVNEVKTLILESVNVWKNYKKRMQSRSSAGVTRPSRITQDRRNVYSLGTQ